jgi:hypothetical protein
VGPRTGLDDVERRKTLPLPGLKLRPLCRPTRIESLYYILNIRGKGKFVPVLINYAPSHEDIWRSGGIPIMLALSIRLR